jgi:uncharacterized protein (DUF1697 family)
MRYAAFLRAVNVAGNQLSMAALKTLFAKLHFGDVRTLLQSGNIVFEAEKQNRAALEALLERETEKQLKVHTEYFIRDAKDLAHVIEHNPFTRAAKDDPQRLVVFFLKDAPGAKHVSALQARIKGPETVAAGARHLYVTYPAGMGKSKLTNAVIEKALDTRGTARNWNTVLKAEAAMK